MTGPYDQVGFGSRGVFPSTVFTFTGANALSSVVRTLGEWPGWVFGGVLLIALCMYGLWRNRRRGPALWAVAGIAVSFTVGYAMFWSSYAIVKLWPGAITLGPFYHLALLIPVALLGAGGLTAIFERHRAASVFTVAVLMVGTALTLAPKIDASRRVTTQYRAVKDLVDRSRLSHAILFMTDRGTYGFESTAPFLENQPDLNQAIVYAIDDGPSDLAVIARLPGRTAARMRSELLPGDNLLHPTQIIERLQVRNDRAVTLDFTIINTVGAPVVTTRLVTPRIDRTIILDTKSTQGRTYDVAWTFLARNTRPTGYPNPVELTPSSGTITIEADFEAPTKTTDRYQLQYPYVANTQQVSLLTPGWGRYLFQYHEPVWLNQDVAPTLVDTSTQHQ